MGADLDVAIECRQSESYGWYYVLGSYRAVRGPITDLFGVAGVDHTDGLEWDKWCRDYDRCTLSRKTVECIGLPPESDSPYWVRVLTPKEFAKLVNDHAMDSEPTPILSALCSALESLERLTTHAYRVVVWYGQ